MPFPPRAAAVFLLLLASLRLSPAEERITFIVLVDPSSKPSLFPAHLSWYSSILSSSSSSSSPPSLHIHVYSTILHGFSARLTPAEARGVRASAGVLAVRPDALLRPLTTRSPTFLGLDSPWSSISQLSDLASDSVVGVIDTGIWPESPSFADSGDLGPAPHRWKGECEDGPGFNRSSCSGKLVGARSFYAGYLAASLPALSSGDFLSARDADGHGTHVASIAAGGPVGGAGFQGFARGVARGMAPKARIAVYKVCWPAGCLVSDIVAAIDRAVADGVDILSMSLGSSSPVPAYHLDALSVATFRATMAGVLVVSSAGNGGPRPRSISNAPPWVLTVGAGTMDRSFPAVVVLGEGERRVEGTSITFPYPRRRRSQRLRLFSAATATPREVEGSAVFFRAAARNTSRLGTGAAFRRAGAAAMVIAHGDVDPAGMIAEPHVIPTVAVGESQARSIERYIASSRDPTAVIFSEGTDLGRPAPAVASFSSRGPNAAVARVLKPDLLAPGVNVLAAWTGSTGPSCLRSDPRRTGFNVMSGTSMACPHVSGVAALVKAAHPSWAPGEMKSALMTTASAAAAIQDESTRRAAGPFDMGAGHVRPEAALDPGLVYPAELEDYVDLFVCELNYTEEEVRVMTGGRRTAPVSASIERCRRRKADGGANYPGFVVEEEAAAAAMNGEVAFYRRLRRVDGGAAAVYFAEVAAPEGYTAAVEPVKLRFDGRVGETAEFKLTVRFVGKTAVAEARRRGSVSGHLTWKEDGGNRTVRTPIAAFSARLLLPARF
ncbi:unnamed protein product [Spirodela intermedia]|uniref:Uncharacterized protein n=1 Tax=Spirodela intermedia TaxID=51605 RepID=A0A7I8KNR6_SPIIN|nr:unnamed protein product [Spirodela intermedia]